MVRQRDNVVELQRTMDLNKINASRGDGWTVLHHAVELGRIDCFRFLLTFDEVDLNALTLYVIVHAYYSFCSSRLMLMILEREKAV